jgi:hypothetical protein
MKFASGVLLISLFASSALAQQASTPSSAGNGAAGRSATDVFISFARNSMIRIIGTPRNQPNPGRNIECSPVEQGIAGLIIGPTDLCDR